MEKLYLLNTYVFQATAKVVSCTRLENAFKGGSHCLTLNKTLFHPQGGGQPSDKGKIYLSNNSAVQFQVLFVQNGKDTVEHYGIMDNASSAGSSDSVGTAVESVFTSVPSFEVDCDVTLEVDESWRRLTAKLHSAGHLIDAALARTSGYGELMEPTKGYHFPDAPYVEYAGILSAEQMAALPALLNTAISDIVAENIPTEISTVDKAEAQIRCEGQSLEHYPETLRLVTLANCVCPCGGTHVNNSSELAGIVVTKVKQKKGAIKVSYILQQ